MNCYIPGTHVPGYFRFVPAGTDNTLCNPKILLIPFVVAVLTSSADWGQSPAAEGGCAPYSFFFGCGCGSGVDVYAFSSCAYFSTSFFNPNRGNCTVILAFSPSPSRWSTIPSPYFGCFPR